MRRINVEAKERDLGWQARNRLKQRLGRKVLAGRKASEPSLAFPERHRDFATKTANASSARSARWTPSWSAT